MLWSIELNSLLIFSINSSGAYIILKIRHFLLNKFKKKGRKLSKKLFIEKLKAKNVKEDIINDVKNGNEENAKTICVNALTKRKCAENSSKN